MKIIFRIVLRDGQKNLGKGAYTEFKIVLLDERVWKIAPLHVILPLFGKSSYST